MMIGKRVKLIRHPYQPIGTITEVNMITDMVTVEWDDRKLIPPSDRYPSLSFADGTFIFIDDNSPYHTGSCECGAKYNRDFPHIHSFWCPRWRKL